MKKNNMKEVFENQIKISQPLTKTVFDELKRKTYFNNDDILIGDVVLYAFTEGETEDTRLSLTLISLNERHFDLFEVSEFNHNQNKEIPIIKLKNKLYGNVCEKSPSPC